MSEILSLKVTNLIGNGMGPASFAQRGAKNPQENLHFNHAKLPRLYTVCRCDDPDWRWDRASFWHVRNYLYARPPPDEGDAPGHGHASAEHRVYWKGETILK